MTRCLCATAGRLDEDTAEHRYDEGGQPRPAHAKAGPMERLETPPGRTSRRWLGRHFPCRCRGQATPATPTESGRCRLRLTASWARLGRSSCHQITPGGDGLRRYCFSGRYAPYLMSRALSCSRRAPGAYQTPLERLGMALSPLPAFSPNAQSRGVGLRIVINTMPCWARERSTPKGQAGTTLPLPYAGAERATFVENERQGRTQPAPLYFVKTITYGVVAKYVVNFTLLVTRRSVFSRRPMSDICGPERTLSALPPVSAILIQTGSPRTLSRIVAFP